MIRPSSRSVGAARRLWLGALPVGPLMVGALLVAGCGAFGREPFEVPPGHRTVLGEILIRGFNNPRVILELTRDDGSYQLELPVDAVRSPFVITLPPGHYLITRLRVNDQGRTGPESTNYRLAVEFDVGDPAVYVGTLQIERVVFLRQLRVTVEDEYESAVPAIRARYPELPPTITRSLMRPA